MLRFKWLLHIGVWAFTRFVRPLLTTILCVRVIWSGSNNRVYMYRVSHWLAKKNKKACHRTDFETDLWPETRDLFWPCQFYTQSLIFVYSQNSAKQKQSACVTASMYWFPVTDCHITYAYITDDPTLSDRSARSANHRPPWGIHHRWTTGAHNFCELLFWINL